MDPVNILIILILISSTQAETKKTILNNIEIQPQIVNGSDARIEEFPFIVSVQNIVNETHSFHSCGGSILNAYWILTVCRIMETDETKTDETECLMCCVVKSRQMNSSKHKINSN
jgi:secreted trypsin-like serine protease